MGPWGISPWQVYCTKYTYMHCLTPTPTRVTHIYDHLRILTHTYNILKWNMKYQNLQHISLCNTLLLVHECFNNLKIVQYND